MATDTEAPERRARRTIDAMLDEAGWAVQDRRDMNLLAAPGVAVRELRFDGGLPEGLLPCPFHGLSPATTR